MWSHVIAVAALSVGCGLWVVVQRWISARDANARSVEDACGSCSQSCEELEDGVI